MKTKVLQEICVLTALAAGITSAAPLGTAFNYQGRLNSGTNPANGRYDLRFTLYDAASGGTQVGLPQATNALAVSNGFFTVALDFGAGVFTGDARWLDITVKTNGAASYTTLVPRQPLAPTPYASFSSSAGTSTTAANANVAHSTTANAVNNASLQANSITSDKLATSIGFWNKSGNNLFYNAGNVGVGTASPTAKLDVAGGVRCSGVDLLDVASVYGMAGYYTEISHNLAWDPGLGWVNQAAGPGSVLTVAGGANQPGSFFVQVSQLPTNAPPGTPANLTPGLTINSSGYVGIGTYNPDSQLDLRGVLKLGAAPSYWSDIFHNLYWGGTPATWRNTGQGPGVRVSLAGGANHPGAFEVQVSPLPTTEPPGSEAGLLTAFRVISNGNVGIGVWEPAAKLEVQGGPIKATGGLIIETRTSDPPSPVTGQIWLRTDL